MKPYLLLIFFITGCSFLTADPPKPEAGGRKSATCTLKGFPGFPRSVTGPVVFLMKRTITIAVFNRKKTERFDMTFSRNRCR